MDTRHVIPRRIRIIRYYAVAEAAARSERAGQYFHAAKLWRSATFLALNNANRIWAENRCDFCLRVLHNGWSDEHANE